MSAFAFGWAWGLSLPPAEKMVLLALADVSSPEQERFPCPTEYIESVAGMTNWEIAVTVASLMDKGLVEHSHGLYRLALPPKAPAKAVVVPLGCVYVMVSGEKTKVGISVQVEKRLLALRGALPDIRLVHSFPMQIDRARKVEAECLLHFSGDALHGEWVSTPADAVIRHLQALTGLKGEAANG